MKHLTPHSRRFRKLDSIHPSVRDPGRIAGFLALGAEDAHRLDGLVDRLTDVSAEYYLALPQQIVHRDFDGSNILMRDGRVSGALDFEFAAKDLRCIDLAVSLCGFSAPNWRDQRTQNALAALVAAYRSQIDLLEGEVRALPDVMLLYRLVSLVHRVGRFLAGRSTKEAAMRRLEAMFDLEDWLREQPAEANNVLTGG